MLAFPGLYFMLNLKSETYVQAIVSYDQRQRSGTITYDPHLTVLVLMEYSTEDLF